MAPRHTKFVTERTIIMAKKSDRTTAVQARKEANRQANADRYNANLSELSGVMGGLIPSYPRPSKVLRAIERARDPRVQARAQLHRERAEGQARRLKALAKLAESGEAIKGMVK